MNTDWLSILLGIFAGGISVAITFYIKEFLQRRADYHAFKNKVERIAGKNATILYSGTGVGQQVFKIVDIDQHGLVLKDELQTIYVPISKLISSDFVLPVDNYEVVRIEKVKRDMKMFSQALMPMMFDEMLPAFMDAVKKTLKDDFLSDDGDFSAIVGVKIMKVLNEEGFEIKKLPENKK